MSLSGDSRSAGGCAAALIGLGRSWAGVSDSTRAHR